MGYCAIWGIVKEIWKNFMKNMKNLLFCLMQMLQMRFTWQTYEFFVINL
jgi:hypothetical protein